MRANQALESQANVEKEILLEQIQSLQDAISRSSLEIDDLQEAISGLDLYLDMRGWSIYGSGFGGYEENGPSLFQLHTASKRLRDMTAMQGWVKRGRDLRAAYIWDGGIHYDPEALKPRQGRPNVQKRIDDPINQANFFSPSARFERETSCYTDSQPFIVGDSKNYTLHRIPISQITAYYVNPEYTDEVWAYRRAWTDPNTMKQKVEWIWRNRYWSMKNGRKFINYEGKQEPLSAEKRMFGSPVNGQVGFPFGLPDALAGLAWAEQYSEFLRAGKKMSDAMARLWGQVESNTPAGARNAISKVRTEASFGEIAASSGKITAMTTAGQSYDFAKGIDILAAFAASINVSVVTLSANPAAAGGSYGAAKALDLPEQLTTRARRDYHIELDREVLTWLGAPADIDIWFETLRETSDIYRDVQGIVYKWNTGLFSPEEIKLEFQSMLGQQAVKPIPEGVLLPNNIKSKARKDIDTDSDSDSTGGGGMIPGQGQGADGVPSGSGDQNANDINPDR